jgi:hypothetical protein
MRSTRTYLLPLLLLLFGVGQIVHAQRVDEIAIGETKNGALTATSTVISYFFNATANQVLTIQLVTTSAGFVPVLMVASSDNTVLATYSAPPETTLVSGVITIPVDGRYFVQVQGANGTRGDFALSLLEGDLAPLPPAPTATVPINREPLTLDGVVQAQLSEGEPEKQYTFSGAASLLVVQVLTEGLDGQLAVTLTNAASGEVIASYQPFLIGGAFIVPPSTDGYVLSVRHTGGQPRGVTISLSAFDGSPFNPAAPTSTPIPSATAVVVPTAASPEDVDILLRWGNTFLTVSNVSGTALDIRTLAFAGNNRRADMAYWLISAPELDLRQFPSDACGGFRPLAYPEAPPVPPGCNEVAAWRSDDIVFFWGGSEFDVLYNGLVVATCPTSQGQCGVDLPNT